MSPKNKLKKLEGQRNIDKYILTTNGRKDAHNFEKRGRGISFYNIV